MANMTVKQALKQFDDADLVSLAWLIKFVIDHQEQAKKLLENHDVEYTGDPLDTLNKIITMAGMRGSFFTGDLEDVAREAHYFSLGNIIPKVTNFFGGAANALSTIAAPVVTALTGMPAAGAAASGLLSSVGNHLQNKNDTPPAGAGQAPAPVAVSGTPETQSIANTVRDIARDAADEEETPTFWEANKTVIIVVGLLVIVTVISLIIYFRWKKKQGKKD